MRQVDPDFNILCLLPAAVLGFRHGLDWDHVAAIADVTGGEIAIPGGQKLRFLELPMLYAVGHLTSIAVLALLARYLTQQLPSWLDPMMEKAVGTTLVIIGAWLGYSIVQDVANKRQARFVTRWGLLSNLVAKLFKRAGHPASDAATLRCPPKAAFGLGILHGIGAETGTQVILLAAVSGGSSGGAVLVLTAFALGLLVSNCAVAVAIAAGMLKAAQTHTLSAILGLIAAGFSIVIGACLLFGTADLLPSLADYIPTPKLH